MNEQKIKVYNRMFTGIFAGGGVPSVAHAEGATSTPDNDPPVLNELSFSPATVNAGESVDLTIDAYDKISGISSAYVEIYSLKTKNKIGDFHFYESYYDSELRKTVTFDDGKLHSAWKVNKYLAEGDYFFGRIIVYDNANNSLCYVNELYNHKMTNDQLMPDKYADMRIRVTNSGTQDVTVPVIKDVVAESSTAVTAGNKIMYSIYMDDDYSGNDYCFLHFYNPQTDKTIGRGSSGPGYYDANGKYKSDSSRVYCYVESSVTDEPGDYYLAYVTVKDNAANVKTLYAPAWPQYKDEISKDSTAKVPEFMEDMKITILPGGTEDDKKAPEIKRF
ncbi:MAG: hypothetical protein K6E19_05505, partial [Lachnospiraceae bacterium]|nr:hypothetical protein [Lachnospiraceae bacterium]